MTAFVGISPVTLQQEERLARGELLRRSHVAHAEFRLADQLDVERLQVSVAKVLDRHPVLSARFALGSDGTWMQWTVRPSRPSVETLSGIRATELEGALSQAISKPLGANGEALVRVSLIESEGDSHVVLAVEHLVADGRTLTTLLREIRWAYEDHLGWAGPETAFRQLALEQRASLAAGDADRAIEWFRRQWGDTWPLPSLVLPSQEDALRQTGSCFLELDAAASRAVADLSRQLGATPYLAAAAAFAIGVRDLSKGDDIPFLTTISTRGPGVPDNAVGDFTNMLPILARVPLGASLADVLKVIRPQLGYLLGFAQVPVQHVAKHFGVEAVNPHQIYFGTYEEAPASWFPGSVRLLPPTESGRYIFSVWLVRREGGMLSLRMLFDQRVLDKTLGDRLLVRMVQLLTLS